jgi:hypothetical protein
MHWFLAVNVFAVSIYVQEPFALVSGPGQFLTFYRHLPGLHKGPAP